MPYLKRLRRRFPSWESIRDHLHRYYGLKTMVVAMLTLFFTTVIVTALWLGILPRIGFLFSEIWWHYVYLYWINHLALATVFIALSALILWFNAFQASVNAVYPMPPLYSEEEDRTKRFFRRLSRGLGMVFLVEFAIAVPLLHLWALTWAASITIVASAVSLLTPILSSQIAKKKYLKSPATYRFANTASFNTAAKGTQSFEVLQELAHFSVLREANPISPSVASFIRSGDGVSLWKGYERLYEELAKFLDVPPAWITAHHSATDGFAWCLKLAVADECHLIFSDLDYHSMKTRIAEAVPENEHEEKLHQIFLQEEHLRGTLDARAIEERLIAEISQRCKSIDSGRIIILLSHVIYLTGVVLDVRRVHDDLIKSGLNPDRLVFVIDGAQALGNIVIDRRVIEIADFYVSSGHKWLLASGTLGLVIHDFGGKQSKSRYNPEHVYASLRPFAYAQFIMDDHALTETIDLEPMVSLNAMMAEFNRLRQEAIAAHNKALSTLFGEQTFSLPGVSILSRPIGSGIVSIRLSEGTCDVVRLAQVLETHFGMVGQTFETNIFRFSFHYYMGQREIYELADALFKAMRLARSSAV